MFEHRLNPTAVRSFMVAVCLALLGGCGANANILAAGKSIAAAPADLSATAGNAVVTLAWTPSSGATGYHVKRATTTAGPFADLASPTSPTYTDSTVTNGVAYHYVVSALDTAGESPDSAAAMAIPEAPTEAPMPPADLTGAPGNARASLTWSASTGATSYHVKRAATSGGPYSQLATVTSPSYTDTTAGNGTTYFYVVTALNSGGESADSGETSVTPDPTITMPPAPAGLTAAAGAAQVILTWSASSGATGYHVKRATTSGGPYAQLATVSSPSYTDAAVSGATSYYYVVSAVNSSGESADSAPASVTTPDPIVTVPAVPTGLTANAENAQVSLTWSASGGATSYRLKRATASTGPFAQIAAPASPGYMDTSVANGTAYHYVVSAVDSAGESANSAPVSALPAVPNPPPTVFGTWTNVTPAAAAAKLNSNLSCGNYGAETVQADTAHPSNLYSEFHCQGIWKSTDYGATWTGPINTGSNAAAVSDCAGGITVSPSSTGGTPTLYQSCIRGSGTGFWKSLDGGVNWTRYFVAPTGTSRQDFYPPVVDPSNPNHLLMAGHEMDSLVQSIDGGQTWTNVSLNNGMMENGGTGYIFFIHTGTASTSATWLWLAQQSGGVYGTWRTANSGATWTQVDKNEHPHGSSQIYQPDTSGVVYMAGAYSASGWGVLRSTDYGQHWSHVGGTSNETSVVGTSKNVYAMFGYPIGIGAPTNAAFETAAQPGTGAWASPATPGGLTQGPGAITVVNDGTHNILVGAMHNSGIWRYIEP